VRGREGEERKSSGHGDILRERGCQWLGGSRRYLFKNAGPDRTVGKEGSTENQNRWSNQTLSRMPRFCSKGKCECAIGGTVTFWESSINTGTGGANGSGRRGIKNGDRNPRRESGGKERHL